MVNDFNEENEKSNGADVKNPPCYLQTHKIKKFDGEVLAADAMHFTLKLEGSYEDWFLKTKKDFNLIEDKDYYPETYTSITKEGSETTTRYWFPLEVAGKITLEQEGYPIGYSSPFKFDVRKSDVSVFVPNPEDGDKYAQPCKKHIKGSKSLYQIGFGGRCGVRPSSELESAQNGFIWEFEFPEAYKFYFSIGDYRVTCFRIDGVDYYSINDLIEVFDIGTKGSLDDFLPEYAIYRYPYEETFIEDIKDHALILEQNIPMLLICANKKFNYQIVIFYLAIGQAFSEENAIAHGDAHALHTMSLYSIKTGFSPHTIQLMVDAWQEEDYRAHSEVIFGTPEENAAKAKEYQKKWDNGTYKNFVYVIKDTLTGHVKIGMSKDVESRLGALLCSHSDKNSLVVVTKKNMGQVCSDTEQALHKMFDAHRLNGEWFDGSQEENIVKAIESGSYKPFMKGKK